MRSHRIMSVLMAFALASATAHAVAPNASPSRNTDVQVSNWDAPPTWTPSAEARDPGAAEQDAAAAAISGLRGVRQPLIVLHPTPLTFVPITPCRVADTRGNGFTGAYGIPSIGGGGSRTFAITGQCGIPVGVEAVSFNFTVWNTLSYGDLKVYPTGGAVAAVSTLNWNPGMLALANAAVVPLGVGANAGYITTVNESGSQIDLFFDVNGYYGPTGSLPHGVNYSSGTVNADPFYSYPEGVTLPTGGACLVTSQAQLYLSGSPTSTSVYFRIAVKRGAAADTTETMPGHYFGPLSGSWSADMSRTSLINVMPNEATDFGCMIGGVNSGDQAGNLYLRCQTSYLCF